MAGHESIDYNGGAVPAMIAETSNLGLINGCTEFKSWNKKVLVKEKLKEEKKAYLLHYQSLLLKKVVQQSDSLIPNMRE